MEDRHIQDLAFWITYLGDAGSEKKKNIVSLLTLIDRGLLGLSDLRSNRHRLESASKLRKSGLQPIRNEFFV